MFRALPLMLSALIACGASSPQPPPLPPERTLYVNGKVWQGPSQPDAEAFAVEGGTVAAVGSTQALSAQPYTKLVDLGGRRVVPALIDAHAHPEAFAHPAWLANGTDWVERGEYGPTAEEGRALVAAKAAQLPVGTPVVLFIGINFYSTAPDDVRAFLDAAAPNHPVVAADWGGHGLGLNSMALASSGYADGAGNPYGGRLSRDVAGRLTGWAQELAEVPVFHFLTSHLPDDALAGALVGYGQAALGYGFRKAYDINFAVAGERMPAIRAMVASATPFTFEPVSIILAEGSRPGPNADGRRVWKVFLDGAPGDCTAHRRPQPPLAYTAPEDCPIVTATPWYGAPDIAYEQLVSVLRDARSMGAHVLFHALGDGAVEDLLRALGEVGGNASWRGVVTLEHGDMMTVEQARRLQLYGVPLVQNATHLLSVPGLNVARFDVHTLMDTELLASVRDAHVELAFGTDAFAHPTSPWLEMELAVTHPFNPAEAIRREEFLLGYTHMAAQARGQVERALLEVGQPADFAVLSQDVLDEQGVPTSALSDTLALLTVVNGEVAYTTGEVQ